MISYIHRCLNPACTDFGVSMVFIVLFPNGFCTPDIGTVLVSSIKLYALLSLCAAGVSMYSVYIDMPSSALVMGLIKKQI
ncbi:hypothetical protein EV401DRAFT_1973505, partial [Pisolithus croceorrhizus]